jgi:hypothetical protein
LGLAVAPAVFAPRRSWMSWDNQTKFLARDPWYVRSLVLQYAVSLFISQICNCQPCSADLLRRFLCAMRFRYLLLSKASSSFVLVQAWELILCGAPNSRAASRSNKILMAKNKELWLLQFPQVFPIKLSAGC